LRVPVWVSGAVLRPQERPVVSSRQDLVSWSGQETERGNRARRRRPHPHQGHKSDRRTTDQAPHVPQPPPGLHDRARACIVTTRHRLPRSPPPLGELAETQPGARSPSHRPTHQRTVSHRDDRVKAHRIVGRKAEGEHAETTGLDGVSRPRRLGQPRGDAGFPHRCDVTQRRSAGRRLGSLRPGRPRATAPSRLPDRRWSCGTDI
jgi:hypothetical protein